MQDNTSPNSESNRQVNRPPASHGRHSSLPQVIWGKTASYISVALGSVVGGVTRYLVSVLFVSQLGDGFPWSTLFVNVIGSFVIAFYAALSGPDGRLFATPRQRQFVMVGFCGGFTTFSAFSLETLRLAHSGNLRAAFLNLVISIIGWLVAAWMGHALATRLNRLKGT
jgi:fluoride exporter